MLTLAFETAIRMLLSYRKGMAGLSKVATCLNESSVLFLELLRILTLETILCLESLHVIQRKQS